MSWIDKMTPLLHPGNKDTSKNLNQICFITEQNGWQVFIIGAELCPFWKAVEESRKDTAILGIQRRQIQSGASDEA